MPSPRNTSKIMINAGLGLEPAVESLLILSSRTLSINRRAAIASRENMIKDKFLALYSFISVHLFHVLNLIMVFAVKYKTGGIIARSPKINTPER